MAAAEFEVYLRKNNCKIEDVASINTLFFKTKLRYSKKEDTRMKLEESGGKLRSF